MAPFRTGIRRTRLEEPPHCRREAARRKRSRRVHTREEGSLGLYDREREGRPERITGEVEEETKRLLEENPPEGAVQSHDRIPGVAVGADRWRVPSCLEPGDMAHPSGQVSEWLEKPELSYVESLAEPG
jgi:hypothetical protein